MSFPLQLGILQEAERVLKQHGHTITRKVWMDKKGAYAYMMKSKVSNLPFALVAKGSEVWNDTISIHTDLLNNWQSAIVLAHRTLDYGEFTFYLIDPVRVCSGEQYINERLGVSMTNFNVGLCHLWNCDRDISDYWQEIKRHRSEVLNFNQLG